MKRLKVKKQYIKYARRLLKNKLNERLLKKGHQSYASVHEAYGLIAEEVKELLDAVQSNKRADVMAELLDVAVGCVFAIACNEAGGFDQ